MNLKEFWKKNIVVFVLRNILLAAILIFAILWITFWAINKYTQHGIVEIVSDLRGAYVEEAEVILKRQGLYPQVIDSIYSLDKMLGTIVEQTPEPNATMKRNRPVYLIINSRSIRQIPLPGVNDYSFRQAETLLKASGINIDSVQYTPSEYKDLVIDVKYKGESVRAGEKIPEGESIVLVVGNGPGKEGVVVPNLRNMTLEEARWEIIDASFILGATYFDEDNQHTNEDKEYLIYRQEPLNGRTVPVGSKINVWLTRDEEVLKTGGQETITIPQDEEFF